MKIAITINQQLVHVKLVDYDNKYNGWFNSDTDEIRIVKGAKNIEGILRHELTHAYLYYYGFSGAELSEELMRNFVEIYGPDIIITAKNIFRSWENLK